MPSSSTTTLLALYISQLWQIVTPKTYHAFLDADGTVHSLSPPGSDSECNEAVVASQYECYGSENATLLVRAPDGQSELKTFEVPPLPSQPEAYSYATEEAFLVLPARCALELGLTPNVGDSDNLIEHWMGRMSELPGSTEALMSCACGWIIFVHGSGGFTYDNVRYAIMMAASGYAVIVPDSFASSTLGLRYKAPVANLSAHLTSAEFTEAYDVLVRQQCVFAKFYMSGIDDERVGQFNIAILPTLLLFQCRRYRLSLD